METEREDAGGEASYSLSSQLSLLCLLLLLPVPPPLSFFAPHQTVVLILFAQCVIIQVVLLPWYGGLSMHMVFFTSLTMLALICHTRAQFTDPGAVPWPNKEEEEKEREKEKQQQRLQEEVAEAQAADPLLLAKEPPPPLASSSPTPPPPLPRPRPRLCRKCRIPKPFHAHHCSSCKRCIIRMDHHCPWVNNCVAMRNQKFFLLFLVYTTLSCIYAAALLIGRFISCTRSMRTCGITGLQAGLCIGTLVESIVFGLFCLIMLWDQLAAIFDNTPGIDALQERRGVEQSKYQSLQQVFGEPFRWSWWLPLPLPPAVQREFEREVARMEDPELLAMQEEEEEMMRLRAEQTRKIEQMEQERAQRRLQARKQVEFEESLQLLQAGVRAREGEGSIPLEPSTLVDGYGQNGGEEESMSSLHRRIAGPLATSSSSSSSTLHDDAIHDHTLDYEYDEEDYEEQQQALNGSRQRSNSDLPVVFPTGYDHLPAELAALRSQPHSPLPSHMDKED